MPNPEYKQRDPWKIYPLDPSESTAEDDIADAVLQILFGTSLDELKDNPALCNQILVAFCDRDEVSTNSS